MYKNIVSHVLTRESKKLLNADNSNSPSEQVKANN